MTPAKPAKRELPRYRCHKEVWALKIAKIELIPPGMTETHSKVLISPEDEDYAPFEVSWTYYNKHKPEVGTYWVKYADGYESVSPSDAFEEGYTRI